MRPERPRSVRTALLVAMLITISGCAQGAIPDAPVDTETTTSTKAGGSTSTTTVAPTTTVGMSTTSTSSTISTTTLASSSTSTTSAFPPGSEVAVVVLVTDGDTIDVRLADGTVDTVRLIGINTPERGECFAVEAAEALAAYLPTEVTMTSDTSDRDQYDRLLRYLWAPDGTLINEKMVADGFALARDYPPDTAMAATLSAAQDVASASGLGLWAANACGISNLGTVTVGHIEYDAPGNDHDNLNGEWVELSNPGPGPVDLTGWVLKDESSTHRFRFPAGFTLASGGTVDVFTGCGSDSPDELYWCYHSAVWNNSGDTAFVVDASGNIVDSKSY